MSWFWRLMYRLWIGEDWESRSRHSDALRLICKLTHDCGVNRLAEIERVAMEALTDE